MKTKIAILLPHLVIGALLCGCASLPYGSTWTPDQIGARSTIVRDNFKKDTMLRGMPMVFDLGCSYYLTAFKNDFNTNVLYSLSFQTVRGYNDGWAFWNSAVDQDGKEFPTTIVRRVVMDGGMTSECVIVSLGRPYLESKKTTGVNIRIDGTSGASQVITLTTNYIAGFLMKAGAVFPSAK